MNGAEVLVIKSASPPYTAVMEGVPTARAEVEKMAMPPVSSAVPSVVAPSMNVTEPVGVPVLGSRASTWAVKVRLWPKTPGFADEMRVVFVLDWPTTWFSAGEVVAVKSASPSYIAEIESWPSGRAEVVNLATPALRGAVPSAIAPSRKVTVPPVGVAELGRLAATRAIKVTPWPKTLGFSAEVTVVLVLAWVTV